MQSRSGQLHLRRDSKTSYYLHIAGSDTAHSASEQFNGQVNEVSWADTSFYRSMPVIGNVGGAPA